MGLAAATTIVAALLIGGCSSHGTTATPTMIANGAAAADAMFAQMMIPHHEQAVVMAELAETRASDPLIVELATEIKGAQQPEIDLMTSWLEEWGVPVMSGMDAMGAHGGHGMSGMLTDEQLAALEASNGAEFDRLFAEYMIAHHEGAIDMAQEVTVSDDPRVVKLANDIIEAQQAEIAQMQAFLDGR